MGLERYAPNISIDAAVLGDHAAAFIGTAPYPAKADYVWTCPDHYLMCLPITPRPLHSEAILGNGRKAVRHATGDLWLIPPGFIQNGFYPRQEGNRRDIYCAFPRQWFEGLMGGAIEWSETELRAALDLRDANIHATVRRLASEALNPAPQSRSLVESLATVIAIDTGRFFATMAMRADDNAYSLRQGHVAVLRELVEEHAAENIRIEVLARKVGLSVRHLSRSFKHLTGQTLSAFVSEVRLDLAKRLLSQTDMPIKVIAARVGFGSVPSFTAAFKREVGSTPHAFRITGSLPWSRVRN